MKETEKNSKYTHTRVDKQKLSAGYARMTPMSRP